MRWTAEVAESELSVERVKQCPAAFWNGKKTTFLEYLTNLAVKKRGVAREAVTDDMLKDLSTKVSKFQYLLDFDMGSRGEFEFRRRELAIIKQTGESYISDEDVVLSYEESLQAGGWMREYLNVAQVVCIIHNTLFVHGQIVNGFSLNPKDHTVVLGVVPGDEQPKASLRQWAADLNTWAANQIREWKEKPEWGTPPTESTYESWRGRGASDLIAYGTPGSPWPTVIYCRYLTKRCMPLPMPPDVCQSLKTQGIFNLIVGHTPHGTAPTAMQANGVLMVMGDTSFSDMKSNAAYTGDNRGLAVFDIAFNGHTWSTRGRTEKVDESVEYDMHSLMGDALVGQFTKEVITGKEFFVKAKLSGDRYLLTHIDGFAYKYAVVHDIDARDAIRRQKFNAMVQDGLMQVEHEDGLGRLQLILETIKSNEALAQELDRDNDNAISADELIVALGNRLVRHKMMVEFPHMDVSALMLDLSKMMMMKLSLEDLEKHCEQAERPADESLGIYFPLGRAGDEDSSADDFPRSLGELHYVSTDAILPSDIHVFKEEIQDWMRAAKHSVINLRNAKRSCAAILDGWPDEMTICMSTLSRMTFSDASKTAMGIPCEALYVSFVYPCAHRLESWHQSFSSSTDSADLALLCLGGFAYLDKEYNPVKILATLGKTSRENSGKLTFGKPQKLDDDWIQEAIRLGSFHQITARPMIDAGATDFCWITPGPLCQSGGFGFLGSKLSRALK